MNQEQSVGFDALEPNGDTMLDPLTMRLSFGQDERFICDTMRIYIRDAPGLAQGVLAAIRAEDNSQLVSQAHALKGITGYFSRGEFYAACLELEILGRNSGLPLQSVHALGLWAGVNLNLQGMIEAMRNYIAAR